MTGISFWKDHCISYVQYDIKGLFQLSVRDEVLAQQVLLLDSPNVIIFSTSMQCTVTTRDTSPTGLN